MKPYSKIVGSHECVDIFLESDYDSHFKQLSKSVRQNIRTAYNRMQKDGVDFDFHFYIGGKNIPAKIKRDSKRCYLKRQLITHEESRIAHLLPCAEVVDDGSCCQRADGSAQSVGHQHEQTLR